MTGWFHLKCLVLFWRRQWVFSTHINVLHPIYNFTDLPQTLVATKAVECIGNPNRLHASDIFRHLLWPLVSWLFHGLSNRFMRSNFFSTILSPQELTVSSSFMQCIILLGWKTSVGFSSLYICRIMKIRLMATKLWRGHILCDYGLFFMKTQNSTPFPLSPSAAYPSLHFWSPTFCLYLKLFPYQSLSMP